MCCECSKETSHSDGSFEYPSIMFCLRNMKINLSYILLSEGMEMNKFGPAQEIKVL